MGTQLLPPQKRGQSPQFSAHDYCGQTAAWIKMPLGMEVGLGPGHIVLDGNSAPSPKRGHSPQFPRMSVVQTAGWIKVPLGVEVGLGPCHIVLDGDVAPPSKKGAQPPNFRPMFVVAKPLDGSRCHLIRRSASAQAATPPPKRGTVPQFSVHVYCDQTVAHLLATAEHLYKRSPKIA